MDPIPFFVAGTLYHVNQDRHELNLHIRHNGRLIYLLYDTNYFVRSPGIRAIYLKCLQAIKDEDENDGEAEFDEIDAQIWLLEPFRTMVSKLAPPQPRTNAPTLSQYVFPEFSACRLEAVDDKLHPVQTDQKRESWGPPGREIDTNMMRDLESWTQIYDPSQIILSYDRSEDVLLKTPRRVLLGPDRNATCYFLKPFISHGNRYVLERELATLKQIAKSKIDAEAHISRLHGVVRTNDGYILGMLLTWIESPSALQFQYKRRPLQERLRWAAQIRDLVAQLHKNGVVWGDAKLDNILLDKNNDPWIIDFGGGHTPGWVDREKMETVEGDFQGLEKIFERLSSQNPQSEMA